MKKLLANEHDWLFVAYPENATFEGEIFKSNNSPLKKYNPKIRPGVAFRRENTASILYLKGLCFLLISIFCRRSCASLVLMLIRLVFSVSNCTHPSTNVLFISINWSNCPCHCVGVIFFTLRLKLLETWLVNIYSLSEFKEDFIDCQWIAILKYFSYLSKNMLMKFWSTSNWDILIQQNENTIRWS